MNELEKKIESLEGHVGLLVEVIAQQQVLLIRLLAHNQAHMACIRNLLVQPGEERTLLADRIQAVYESELGVFASELEKLQKTGNAIEFLKVAVLPNEAEHN